MGAQWPVPPQGGTRHSCLFICNFTLHKHPRLLSSLTAKAFYSFPFMSMSLHCEPVLWDTERRWVTLSACTKMPAGPAEDSLVTSYWIPCPWIQVACCSWVFCCLTFSFLPLSCSCLSPFFSPTTCSLGLLLLSFYTVSSLLFHMGKINSGWENKILRHCPINVIYEL